MTNRLRGAVVVGIDGSDLAAEAARWAAAYAARHRRVLRLVRAYQLPRSTPPEANARMHEHARRQLWTAAHLARTVAPELAVEHAVVEDDPFEVLARESADAQTLVLGARGVGGFAALLVGSVSDTMARRAECPVVVVRGPAESAAALTGTDHTRPVVAGVDGSPASEAALAFAFAEADAWGAPLVAVHASADLQDPEAAVPGGPAALDAEESQVLACRLAGWSEKYPGVPVRQDLVQGAPARALVERSVDARLVVVGSTGRARVAQALLGSTARAVLHHAHSPVAVVRGL
ncbi:universal stress protein [Pseudonocardia yuanmonensis]|uniref:Universal stress protein n=1 Tax=Pseudonocardia yuanmonensis TaxID=1095914 RepID=A0ABP8WLZ7_9PSEU